MSDLLAIGRSGLMAYRLALDTAGHNIANANTPGYSRQRVELGTRPPAATGAGFLGTGVDVNGVRRLQSDLVQARVVGDAAAFARSQVFSDTADRLDRLLSDADGGLQGPMARLFDAFNGLAQQPGSLSARQAVLGAAEGLSAQFRSLDGQLEGVSRDLDAQLRVSVERINTRTQAIAQLNERIALAYGASGGQPPNDLLDARDRELAELAGEVGIRTVARHDGTVEVFTASGQALVNGPTVTRLGVREGADGRLDILYGERTVLTEQLSGGRLGGALDARRELLEPAQRELGLLAAGLALAINQQHQQGVDLDGQPGVALLTLAAVPARPDPGQSGNAAVSVRIESLSGLSERPLRLSFDGTGWQLQDPRTGNVLPLTGTGTEADPLRGAGLALVVSGTPTAGDRYTLDPLRQTAGALSLGVSEPQRLAAAAATTLDALGQPQPTGPGSGNNDNARALAALAGQGLFGGGQISPMAFQAKLVSGVGIKAQQAGLQRDALSAIQQQTLAEREAISGVNLDEEAADLIRFQQAYQAAARVIQVADTVFQTLLDAVRR